MEKLEISGKTFKMLWTLLLYSVEKGGELFKVLRTVYPYGLSKILADQANKNDSLIGGNFHSLHRIWSRQTRCRKN